MVFTHVKQGALALSSSPSPKELAAVQVPTAASTLQAPASAQVASLCQLDVCYQHCSSVKPEATQGLVTPRSLLVSYEEAVQACMVLAALTKAWHPSPGSHSLLAYSGNGFTEGGEGCLEPQCRTGQAETTAREHTELQCCWVTALELWDIWARPGCRVSHLAPARSLQSLVQPPCGAGLFPVCTTLSYVPQVPCPSFCLQSYMQQKFRHAFKMAAHGKANSYFIEGLPLVPSNQGY